MAGGAGEVELAAAGVEILLALLVGLKRARIVRDRDVHRLAARGERHVGGERRHVVLHIGERRLAIGFAAAIKRELERDDLAFLLVEIGIVLADADALVREAVGIGLAVLERRREHFLAGFERELVGRKLLLLLPLLVQVLVHRIGTVDEILQLQLGEFGGEELLECRLVGGGIDAVDSARRRERKPAERKRGNGRADCQAQRH